MSRARASRPPSQGRASPSGPLRWQALRRRFLPRPTRSFRASSARMRRLSRRTRQPGTSIPQPMPGPTFLPRRRRATPAAASARRSSAAARRPGRSAPRPSARSESVARPSARRPQPSMPPLRKLTALRPSRPSRPKPRSRPRLSTPMQPRSSGCPPPRARLLPPLPSRGFLAARLPPLLRLWSLP